MVGIIESSSLVNAHIATELAGDHALLWERPEDARRLFTAAAGFAGNMGDSVTVKRLEEKLAAVSLELPESTLDQG